MKRARFTEMQIVAILKEADSKMLEALLCNCLPNREAYGLARPDQNWSLEQYERLLSET